MGSKNSKEKDSKNENIGVNSLPEGMVTIRIIKNDDSIWEKQYNIDDTLEQVANDFKFENGMDIIQKNHFIEWRYKKQIIKMDNRRIISLLPDSNIENISPIELEQEIKLMEGWEIHLEICTVVGKPFYNPFEIYTFKPNTRLIKTKIYSQNLIVEKELDKFSIESAYCNGNNHLFLSGGVNPITQEIVDLFWDIDLGSDELNSPIKMIPKKNHSMMYDDKKVYIVGGDNEITLFYNTETENMNKLANLNIIRFEPSLIRSNNYLFCFDTSSRKNNDKFSIEKINLDNITQSKWEIIYPIISPQIGDKVYNQKFFGVIEDYKNNIIFLGGIYDNIENKTDEENNPIMSMKYNINKNIIDKSDIPFQEITFGEKTFLPMDYKNYFILTNFPRKNPKIVFFGKEKDLFKLSSYKSNHRIKKKKSRQNARIYSSKIKDSLTGLNFDMPGLHKKINLNTNNNIRFSTERRKKNINDKQEIDNFKNDIIKENEDTIDNNNINTGININMNSDFSKLKTFNTINIKEPEVQTVTNPVENVDLNPKDININNGLKNEDKDINEENNNKNIEINIRKSENDINMNPNINTGNINVKIETDIDANTNAKINTDINTNINTNINTDLEPEVIKKKNDNENDDIVPKFKTPRPKAEIFIAYKNFFNFHNSVYDPSSYIKRPKIRNISLPKIISSKKIKLHSKGINKNIYRINNY